jgi:glyoxylase-like metal-dependent hydrolase (beta-lactamase superfamily II)
MCDETAVKAVKAPGHTSGSMVYLIDNKFVFTGDALRVNQGKAVVHPYSMDEGRAKQTIAGLKETIEAIEATEGSPRILTAHYGYYEKLEWE